MEPAASQGQGQGITWGSELDPPVQIRKGMCFQERFQQSYPLDQLEVTEAEQGQLSFSLLPCAPGPWGCCCRASRVPVPLPRNSPGSRRTPGLGLRLLGP